jgi:signal transduction histidine kinase
MMISFTIMLALAFGVGGSALITASTSSAFDQSRDAAANSHRLILYTLSAVSGSSQKTQPDREYDALVDALTRLDEQSGHNWLALRLSDNEDIIYVSRMPGIFSDDLIQNVNEEQFAMLAFRGDEGAYLLQIAGQFEFSARTLYFESVYDISAVFTARQHQQSIYRQLFIVIIILGAVISWLLSVWMTYPLRRLSRVTRTIASGDLGCRAALGGKDEIGILASDFNNMADRLEQNINEMKDTMRRQEEFMGGFAHELKTPMTSIIGYADLLRGHTMSDDDKRDAANYIFMEGRRLEVLSLKLLDLIVLKKRDFTFLPISMSHIIEDAARLLKPVLIKRNVMLSYECDLGTCMIEPDLFMSLLLNLIDNARKALDMGGEINIRSRTSEGTCEISVSDNGRGIPEEELSKIKEAFYRVDKSRSRAQGGVGLGLRLCDEIAALHGGEIIFESEPGKGTTVTVKLKAEE